MTEDNSLAKPHGRPRFRETNETVVLSRETNWSRETSRWFHSDDSRLLFATMAGAGTQKVRFMAVGFLISSPERWFRSEIR